MEYLSADKKPIIDYIRGDMIYPLSWDNGKITECAFGSLKHFKDGDAYYIQLHRLEGKEYVLETLCSTLRPARRRN